MSDLISRADAICEVLVNDGMDNIVDRINALPSAELPKGDLISRADAIYAVCKLCVDGQTAKVDGYFIPIRDALENVLKALPSADAERETVTVYRGECIIHWDRPHGEWRKGEVKYDVDDDVLYETYYKCDQCGYVENLDYPPNYCANCGADMRKESDTE